MAASLFIFSYMIRIAIQAKGRLSEDSLSLLREAGIDVDDSKRQFLLRSSSHPAEILFLRDDDIPQAVALGVADIGIVGYTKCWRKARTWR
jgi:ATP phosphoribosyltransferase